MTILESLNHICWYVKRALQDQTPRNLRAFSYQVELDRKLIRLRAHFDSTPSEDELEEISCVETEIIADFDGATIENFDTDVEVVPVGQPLSFLPGGIAYLRAGESGTVCS